ncbi:helicase [Anoxybacter fermentans]|uniref:Helicase n=1 Tax=Anoxybacter fermentans TaxID=1323375 RepID=A0A3Q9HP36_9FIRM|nr:SNF2-related protein [Anoxybacter fermentans]AZR72448.1 helicase [Anoxybacter fermentans]
MAIESQGSKRLLTIEELKDHWEEIGMELFPHQIECVDKVIHEMDGRALLADEVGLGKTIEAGMILKELLLRGKVKTFLILVPASLGYQWWFELSNKFKIDVWFNRKGRGLLYYDQMIASLDMCKRKHHADGLIKKGFDMVIVDEAHKLKNRNTLNWKFVNTLPKKYCLLLTATPIQNDLEELYNLVSIIKPDIFGSYKKFRDDYTTGKRKAKNQKELQHVLEKVMIRNSRQKSTLSFPARKVKLINLQLTPEEKELYDKVTRLVRIEYRKRQREKKSILFLLTLQREVCSSSFALLQTLEKMIKKGHPDLIDKLKELYQLAAKIRVNAKMRKVLEILKSLDGQAIIFTEFRATQWKLCEYLQQNGLVPVAFNGSMSANRKEWMKAIFREKGDVLVSTEAGGQGLNFQFCDTLINYDLPWNPMRIEQRIGRIHRLGQRNDVKIYNFSTIGTIEENIVNLLHEKINLFESVIGKLECIIKDNEKAKTFEGNIFKLIAEAEDDNDLRERFDTFGKAIVERGHFSLS